MSVSQNLNKFSFANPSLGQIAPTRSRPRASTIGDPRPRSATKRGISHGAHDTPLMVRTMHHRKVRSAPCIPRSTKRHATHKTLLANGLKSHTLNSSKPRPRGRMPATRTSRATNTTSLGHVKTVDHSFKAPEPEKAPELHSHTQQLMAPIKVQKLAQKWAARAMKKAGKPRATKHKATAPGHEGINTTEHVYSFKEPEDKPDETEIQNTVGGTALTSSTPTALSSHMDPRLLQAASGIQGTGLMGAQLSTIPQDTEVPLDGQETPTSAEPGKFDAAVLATHPEQIGDGVEDEMLAEERVPSDPMKVKLIDAPAVEVDGTPSPSLVLPPQASSAPPPEDLSSTPTTPGAVSPGLAPQLGTLPPQPSQLSGPLPATQLSAPAYSYEGYDSSPYGENLYNQQPGYDPLQDQYHMSAPLLENGHQGGGEHMYYPQPTPSRYPQNHKSYYHLQSPDKYNFTKAIQNYDRTSQNDGTYCYSCIMFFGVLMIGVGIIMIIVELFDLFGRHKDMPLAIAGGGTLALGIIVLASAMLLWRRRRTHLKKKAAHV